MCVCVCVYVYNGAQVRLVNLSHALVFATVRGETKEEDLERLVADGLGTKDKAYTQCLGNKDQASSRTDRDG